MTAPNPSKPWPNELILAAQALSEQTLQSDGWVLDIDAAFAAQGGREINAGTSRRTDLPGVLSLQSHGGQALACVFRAQAQGAQGPWRVLERHQLGSQTIAHNGNHAGLHPWNNLARPVRTRAVQCFLTYLTHLGICWRPFAGSELRWQTSAGVLVFWLAEFWLVIVMSTEGICSITCSGVLGQRAALGCVLALRGKSASFFGSSSAPPTHL